MALKKEPAKKPPASKFHTWFARGLIAAGVIGLFTSGILLLRGNHPGPPKGVSLAGAPSSVKPTPRQVQSYSVPASYPKYISIPAIGVDQARVVGIGLKGDQISNPDNIYDAGWYRASAQPGQAGAMFIFGHLSSWTSKGLFYDLHKLKPGDQITITRGDNKVFSYKVARSQTYPADQVDMDAVLSPVSATKPGLNLMTCAGTVIKGTSEFTERLVVFTSQA